MRTPRFTAPVLEELLLLPDFSEIFAEADALRQQTVGDVVHIRAILEFSNVCRRACAYCGLNCNNSKVDRCRMRPEEMVQTAAAAWQAGYKTLVLQSGEDPFFTPKLLGEIIRQITKTGMVITVSCGEMSDEDYAYLRECGATRYLLKHETADPVLYRTLHPDSTLDARTACLRTIKRLGYETGGGFMIGLPGQTTKTIAADLLLLWELECDMAGIGPFIAHPDTPLAGNPSGSTELTKRAVALARLLLPTAHLPATTALGVIDGAEKNDVFSCGANVVMRKVTPDFFKEKYSIYPAAFSPTDISADRAELETQIRALGRTPL